MAAFIFGGERIELPGVLLDPKSRTQQEDAWLSGQFLTIRLLAAVRGVRVHTNGRSFPGRRSSGAAGAWVALGDVIQTSAQLRGTRALPGAFTHVSEAVLPEQCVVNVGLCSALFRGAGGGVQAEYVSGPTIRFAPLEGKYWHGFAGNA